MKLDIRTNFDPLRRAEHQKQARYAAAVALNKTAEWVVTDERREMRKVFDRPTAYVLNSMRIAERATRNSLQSAVWFKDRSLSGNSSDLIVPHIEGGSRSFKGMEVRLHRIGVLPAGWFVVPGEGAKLDGNGNMSRGQISFILNYLGAFTEAGFNKINDASRARLKKGSKRKRGRLLFVASPGNNKRLHPGVYERTSFAFGAAIKPLLIFVKGVSYRKRLDFYGIGRRTTRERFPQEFERAYAMAVRTAR